MIRARLARKEDLDALMMIEHDAFGEMGEAAVVAREEMLDRIVRFSTKRGQDGWFWVAEQSEGVSGYVLLQPTNVSPTSCNSWDEATDNGALRKTYHEDGDHLYVVSLGKSRFALPGISDLLAHTTFVRWLRSGKKTLFFCMRMPGFAHAQAEHDISASDYLELCREDGGPQDPVLHQYWELTGRAAQMRLLLNGFPPDKASGGHGVLFIATDPSSALLASAERLYRAGMACGGRRKNQGAIEYE